MYSELPRFTSTWTPGQLPSFTQGTLGSTNKLAVIFNMRGEENKMNQDISNWAKNMMSYPLQHCFHTSSAVMSVSDLSAVEYWTHAADVKQWSQCTHGSHCELSHISLPVCKSYSSAWYLFIPSIVYWANIWYTTMVWCKVTHGVTHVAPKNRVQSIAHASLIPPQTSIPLLSSCPHQGGTVSITPPLSQCPLPWQLV
jgi:hypothetical protein